MKHRIKLFLIGTMIKLLDLTFRYRFEGVQNLEHAKSIHPGGVYILALWHRNALAGITAHEGQHLSPLASRSKDGDIVDYVGRKFGLECVRGSSNHGAVGAVREILKVIKSGKNIAITVDGPKGPLYDVKTGILDIAAKTGVPIIPMATLASKNWVLRNTWDKTLIPKPFSQILTQYGPVMTIPGEISKEERAQYAAKLQTAIHEVERQVMSKF